VWAYTRKKVHQREEKLNSGQDVKSDRYKSAMFHPRHFVGIRSGKDRILPPNDPAPSTSSDVKAACSKNNGSGDVVINRDGVVDGGVQPGEADVAWENNNNNEEGEIDGSDVEQQSERNTVNFDTQEEEEEEDVRYCSLVAGKCCCCCARCGCVGYKMEAEPMPVFDKVIMIFKWIIWAVASGLCLYLVIVNIGAT